MDPRLATSLEGRYTIDREIGRGGMATVYLARDVRHNRNVALKVLNPELGAVLGVERFLAEIQVTANLQHPNLLPLFDSGEANGLLFYVMPYVEGESLRARLEREKQLPVDEAVRITTAIAGALDYAHRHSVIHRDLKPENILMQEGQPLIADFGIALAVSNAGGARITQTGLSLGTPQYMSPEQATGDRVVDGRSDIYSLGAMLYEMLVGDPPHSASTAQAIVAKVLTEKPASVRVSRPNVSPAVDYAIGRALEKLAADRFGTAKEFAEALDGKGAANPHDARTMAAGRRARVSPREIAAWLAALILLAAVAWQVSRNELADNSPVVRSVLDLPPNTRIGENIVGAPLAISPRGDVFAYTMNTPPATFIRHFNSLAVREIAGPTGLPIVGRNLTFSPDGRYLAFTEGNSLYKVGVDGGQAMTVSSDVGSSTPYGITWSANDTIYIGAFTGMMAVPTSGGRPTPVKARDSTAMRSGSRWPLALPDGRTILFVASRSASDAPRLGVFDLRSGEWTVFETPVAVPLQMIAGHLVYVASEGAIMALRFDLAGQKPEGEPTPMEAGVVIDPTTGAKAALSASGTLVYLNGRAEYQPVLVNRDLSSATPLIKEARVYHNPRLSPNAKQLAITVAGKGATDIYVYDIPGNTFTRVTTEGSNLRPEWSPDGKRILFRSDRDGKIGIWWQPVDGSGPAELLYEPSVEPFEAIMSPDAAWLVFRTSPGTQYPRDILAVPMTGEKRIMPLATGPTTESLPRLSPNGKWLAYQGSASGTFQIYVRPFPGNGSTTQVSTDVGTEPVWSRSGTELFYRDRQGNLMSARVTTGDRFSIGERRRVVSGEFLVDASHASYDVMPDGRFIMLKRAGADAQTIIVHNWIRELREKTARKP